MTGWKREQQGGEGRVTGWKREQEGGEGDGWGKGRGG